MPVKVRCSGCEKVLNAPDKLRGKTVKCPKCESPIKIPAPKQKKPAAESDPFGDDFLSDLDLSQAEDQSQRICPRCGSRVTEDDIDCPKCGASLLAAGGAVATTGRRSPVGAKKKKGPNKSLFFQSTWGDAWAFVKKNKAYAIRTSLLSFFLTTAFVGCAFMYMWCINTPPKAFWTLLMFVFFTSPIGWMWHLVTETIKVSLAKKDKLKRVHFDFFACVALGIKLFGWTIVCGSPFLIVMGVPGAFLIHSGAVIPGAILVGVGFLLAYSLLPVAMTHMSMPQQAPGWMPQKVFPGWGRSLGAISYWILILLLTSLPVTGCLGAIGATSSGKLESFYRTMQSNSRIYIERQKAEEDDEVQPPEADPAALPWKNLILPGVLLGVGMLLTGPIVVFNARVVGQIGYYYGQYMDLNPLEKQLVYKARPKPGDEGYQRINRAGLSTVAKGLNMVLIAILTNALCELASFALNFFNVPPIADKIILWVNLGAFGVMVIGVLFCFATPPEAGARTYLFVSFISPIIAIGGGIAIAVGVVPIVDIIGLAVMALFVAITAVLGLILTFIFFLLYLRQLAQYLQYFGGAALADEILILYISYIGLVVLLVLMAIFVPFLGLIGGLVLIFVMIGMRVKMFIGLITLLSAIKEQCEPQ